MGWLHAKLLLVLLLTGYHGWAVGYSKRLAAGKGTLSSRTLRIVNEAPALATCSLLPIIQAFAGVAGVSVETRDISLAARILASFPEHLTEVQQVPDALASIAQGPRR